MPLESLNIEILNPKAKQLLKSLADLKLIRITKKKSKSFTALLSELRSSVGSDLTLEEITAEVEAERAERKNG
jgi:hypothetical protein